MADNFERFMKRNKQERPDLEVPVTKSLTDENGEPLKWTLRPVKTKRFEELKRKYTKQVPIPGTGEFREELDDRYIDDLMVESVIVPDLRNADLQDSYGVHTPIDLLHELIDNPGEWMNFETMVSRLTAPQAVEKALGEAKNS